MKKILIICILLFAARAGADVALYKKASGDLLQRSDGTSMILRGDVKITAQKIEHAKGRFEGINWQNIGIVRADSIPDEVVNISDITGAEIIDPTVEASDYERQLDALTKAAIKEIVKEVESCKTAIRQLAAIIKTIHPAAETQCNSVRDSIPAVTPAQWKARITAEATK